MNEHIQICACMYTLVDLHAWVFVCCENLQSDLHGLHSALDLPFAPRENATTLVDWLTDWPTKQPSKRSEQSTGLLLRTANYSTLNASKLLMKGRNVVIVFFYGYFCCWFCCWRCRLQVCAEKFTVCQRGAAVAHNVATITINFIYNFAAL